MKIEYDINEDCLEELVSFFDLIVENLNQTRKRAVVPYIKSMKHKLNEHGIKDLEDYEKYTYQLNEMIEFRNYLNSKIDNKK